MTSHETVRAETSLCMSVLEAVADAHGIDVLDIETPLGEVIDPDSLEAIWKSLDENEHETGGLIRFDYYDCKVIVRSDGSVEARRL